MNPVMTSDLPGLFPGSSPDVYLIQLDNDRHFLPPHERYSPFSMTFAVS